MKWHLNPLPTIYPATTKPSLQSTPSAPRRPPAPRGELDELQRFKELDKISSVDDIKEKISKSDIFRNFECRRDEKGISIYKITFDDSYIPCVYETIRIDNDLRVILFYGKKHVPLPKWLRKSSNCRLTSFSSLENLVTYIKNAIEARSLKSEVIEELLSVELMKKKGRPKYSSEIMRFALLLRTTSRSAYDFMKNFLPLPSDSVLSSLKRGNIDCVKALEVLLDRGEVDHDIALLIDEMHLQQSSQYDGGDLIGQNTDGELYKGILCYMVVSLKKCVPYILHSVPVTKLHL